MIEQLQGRELDAALARAFGMTVAPFQDDEDYYYADAGTSFADVVSWSLVRKYHDDLNAMHDVEDELERRGLSEKYTYAIIDQYGGKNAHGLPSWQLTHATAEQKARAALAVLTEAK